VTNGDAARESFTRTFGREPGALSSAPGRVNLMGEHTDYNEGLVLPMVIPQRTFIAVAPRGDSRIELCSRELGRLGYELGRERRVGSWADYVQGLTQELYRRGALLRGFDLYVLSDLPIGAGLASSAALLVACARALRTAFGLLLDDLEIARLCRAVEVSFVGAPVGIMDPLAASVGRDGEALFVDTHSLETSAVPLPGELLPIVIASGITHAHGSGDYRLRRAECERAVRLLGVSSLRELEQMDRKRTSSMPPPLGARVRHVLEENERVRHTVLALRAGDRDGLRALFEASHASQRDQFEVSVPEVDRLVEIGGEEPAVCGARLTGGGFGGAVVMLAERDAAAAASERIAHRYAQETGQTPRILLPLGAGEFNRQGATDAKQ
jgi:galactokinase